MQTRCIGRKPRKTFPVSAVLYEVWILWVFTIVPLSGTHIVAKRMNRFCLNTVQQLHLCLVSDWQALRIARDIVVSLFVATKGFEHIRERRRAVRLGG
eukprot:5761800-Amphidinium_carterae.1